MISKKYSAQFKIQMVEEYLGRSKEDKSLSKAKFAFEKGLSDSTFNDWVIKYLRQGQGFCNITNEIVKLNEIEVVEKNVQLIREVTDTSSPISTNIVRMTYNGATIEFDESLLERAMMILKEW